MKMKYLLLLLLLSPNLVHASDWKIDFKQSEIAFSGTHAGNEFTGQFKNWHGDITFDPEALEQATARIEVDLTSATTGNKAYDGALPQKDWLAVNDQHKAVFQAKKFSRVADVQNEYVAWGELTLRGVTVPVSVYGSIIFQGDTATAKLKAVLKRLDFGIGQESDAAGDWVSLEIPLDIKVVANRVTE